jgi:hypothetical protein
LTRSAGEGTPRATEPEQPGPVDKQSVAGPLADPNKWYEIEKVITHRRYRSKDQYLVKWKDSNDTSWVRREDLSPAALQQFYATRKRRRRKKKELIKKKRSEACIDNQNTDYGRHFKKKFSVRLSKLCAQRHS